MSKSIVALPRPSLPENTQQAFWSFSYEERSEIINDMASFIKNRIEDRHTRKKERERCEILAQTGRIERAKTEDIPQINKSWRELLEQHIGQKDEFECWLILADVFPEYTLGQLFNAVRHGEVS